MCSSFLNPSSLLIPTLFHPTSTLISRNHMPLLTDNITKTYPIGVDKRIDFFHRRSPVPFHCLPASRCCCYKECHCCDKRTPRCFIAIYLLWWTALPNRATGESRLRKSRDKEEIRTETDQNWQTGDWGPSKRGLREQLRPGEHDWRTPAGRGSNTELGLPQCMCGCARAVLISITCHNKKIFLELKKC